VSYRRGGSSGSLVFGHLTYEPDAAPVVNETLYDVASVTKSIPTSSIILKLIEEGKLSLDDYAAKYLPELTGPGHEEILVRHLLTFTVAFKLGASMAELAQRDPAQLLTAIFQAPLEDRPGRRYVYTNTPSLLLGMIAERVSGRTLDVLAWERLFGPLGMSHTTFKPVMKIGPAEVNIAPTARDFRTEIRGIVHDPGARAVFNNGQIPGHAGLFSTADDLMKFANMLLANGMFESRRFFTPETIEAMHTNQLGPVSQDQTGLGWSIRNPNVMGKKVSEQAFGKTGFTGTMVLIDPAKDAAFVILSNRTYPETPESYEPMRAVWRDLADLVFGD
jgi:CubicO group peptidase (beta-lactamase class C family)